MSEKRKKFRRLASDYINPYSLDGSFKYDSFSMPKVNRMSKTRKSVGSSSSKKAKNDISDTHQQSGLSFTEDFGVASGVVTGESLKTDIEKYSYQLKSTNSYMPVDGMLKVFVLLDWDGKTTFLKQSSPIFVHRFGNRYTCSCSPDRTQFVDIVSASSEEIDRIHPPCIHICVMKNILFEYIGVTGLVDFLSDKEYEEHHYAKNLPYADEEDETNVLPFLDDKYILSMDDEYSVVKTSFGSLKCLSCKNRESCKHTKHTYKLLDEKNIFQKSSAKYIWSCILLKQRSRTS